ncbi:MAG: hypothetical protein R6V44_13975 [Paracoccaceae bacterium]
MTRFATAAALAALTLGPLAAAPAAALLALPSPGAAGPLLVVAPPWRDAAALLAEAGGRPVGPAAAPLGRLAADADPDHPRAFAARLRAAGALLALDARALARLCGARP